MVGRLIDSGHLVYGNRLESHQEPNVSAMLVVITCFASKTVESE